MRAWSYSLRYIRSMHMTSELTCNFEIHKYAASYATCTYSLIHRPPPAFLSLQGEPGDEAICYISSGLATIPAELQ